MFARVLLECALAIIAVMFIAKVLFDKPKTGRKGK